MADLEAVNDQTIIHTDEPTKLHRVYKGIAYISGPMRGLPEYNYPLFNKVEEKLREEGWDVRNPARHFEGDTTRDFSEYMEKDYQDVLDSDTLFLLPGWQDSEGARLEVQVAKSLGKEFVMVDGASEVMPAELEAANLVRNGRRQAAYGHPSQDFARTALIWSGILGVDVSPLQVALCMAGLKMSRLVGTPDHRDSLVDAHGYFTCYERMLVDPPREG
jgi:hypothetical protein